MDLYLLIHARFRHFLIAIGFFPILCGGLIYSEDFGMSYEWAFWISMAVFLAYSTIIVKLTSEKKQSPKLPNMNNLDKTNIKNKE